MRQVLVTGANRGLGLEFTRQSLEAGDRVFATCRNPATATDLQALACDRLTILPLDVQKDDQIAQLRETLGQYTDRIDLLINNAGVGAALSPYKAALSDLGALERQRINDMFDVNATGPILLTQAVRDLLIASGSARVLVLSSIIGSLGTKAAGGVIGGGRYAYAASKAALNIMSIALANDLRENGVIVVAVHPGYVRTDMGGPAATDATDESARRLLRIVNEATPAESGKLFNHDGSVMPY